MLKLQYFGYLMWRADSLEKTLKLGKIEGRRRRGWQRMRRLDGIISSMDMSLHKLREAESEGQGSLACCGPWGCKELTWLVTEQQAYPSPETCVLVSWLHSSPTVDPLGLTLSASSVLSTTGTGSATDPRTIRVGRGEETHTADSALGDVVSVLREWPEKPPFSVCTVGYEAERAGAGAAVLLP